MGTAMSLEGGDGVRAHDLRGDEEVDAVDEVGGEQGGVEAGAGFGEQGEDAFAGRGGRGLWSRGTFRPTFRGEDFDADAAGAEFGDAGLVVGDGEDGDVVLGGGDEFGVEGHAEGGVEDDALEGAAAGEAAAVGEHGVVGEDGVDADEDGVGLPAERLDGGAGVLRW